MPLTKAQCPNCGSALEVDTTKEAAICPFCNTPYIVEKAINNYTVNVTNNIQADSVIIQGEPSSDFEIDRVTLLKYVGHSKEVVIPDYIEIIEASAFEGCSFIKKVVLPDSVKKIGARAFLNCKELSSLSLPNSLKKIGEYAFCNCRKLSSISIPNSITRINHGTFSGCTRLSSVVLPNSVKSIGQNVFEDCLNLSLTLSAGMDVVPKEAFAYCLGLTSIVIPEGISTICAHAFSGCTGLTSIKLPSSISYIDQGAFFGCTGLTSIDFPVNVDLGSFAFTNCTGLTAIRIPNGSTRIGDFAFSGCKNLTKVLIENPKQTTIGSYAFKDTPSSRKMKDGCYVATCVYGSYDCPEVWTLRRYRDDTLAATWYGRAFIRVYYIVSPTLVKWFGQTRWFKKMWQSKLDRMVKRLNDQGVESTPYQDNPW